MASSGIAALEVSDRIAPGASSSNEVATLLASLNLQQYIGVFLANEVNTIPRLKAMQDVHYHRLGVLLGHQLDIIDRFRSYNESLVHVSQVVGPMSNAPSQQLGHKRDLDSEEPNSKRQRHNVVENSIFPVVEVLFVVAIDFVFQFGKVMCVFSRSQTALLHFKVRPNLRLWI
jgi:hypothetical protein